MGKKIKRSNWLFTPIIMMLLFSVILFRVAKVPKMTTRSIKITPTISVTQTPSKEKVIPTSTPTPTTKPMSFAQRNTLYGPCTVTPVFMYHHIQSKKEALNNKQVSLSTYTETFEEQLKYFQEKGYQTIDVGNLISFFNGNATIPVKSTILTFDDGYEDFYTTAFPLLQKYNFKAVVFLPTGLVNNSGYLSWEQIKALDGSGSVYFGNHTWSHYATLKDDDKIKVEISTADRQLSENGLNPLKVFAYPYGSGNAFSKTYLKEINYNLAFTTTYGKILCAKNNLALPRVRAGNLMPGYYGL